MKKISAKKYFIVAYLLIVLSLVYFYTAYSGKDIGSILNSDKNNGNFNLNKSCLIEFGKPECKNEKTEIKFYNPTNISLSNISVVAKKMGGKDIYNVTRPLETGKTEVLDLFACYSIDSMEVNWCCGNYCYRISIQEYSGELA